MNVGVLENAHLSYTAYAHCDLPKNYEFTKYAHRIDVLMHSIPSPIKNTAIVSPKNECWIMYAHLSYTTYAHCALPKTRSKLQNMHTAPNC